MSEDNNWQEYRDELDGCLATSTPCIPYLGQFLTQVRMYIHVYMYATTKICHAIFYIIKGDV